MADRNIEHVVGDLAISEEETKLKLPRLYKVILLNDDYTPMDFVITVLQSFFMIPKEKAAQIMLEVHTQGRGVCGLYTRDIAETKVVQVNEYSRSHEHPLLCCMEPE